MTEITKAFKFLIRAYITPNMIISNIAYDHDTRLIAVLLLAPTANYSKLITYRYVRSTAIGVKKHQFVNGSIDAITEQQHEHLVTNMTDGADVLEFVRSSARIKEYLLSIKRLGTIVDLDANKRIGYDDQGQTYRWIANIHVDRIERYSKVVALYPDKVEFAICEAAYWDESTTSIHDMVGLYASPAITDYTTFWECFNRIKSLHGY